ncbi:MAG: DUF2442 domain-containing protein [Pseudomonadota bacterium]
MRETVEAIPKAGYLLQIGFSDGVRVTVDVKPLMKRRIFQPLWDGDFFRRVEIDHKFGGLEWPNGADICIDWIEAQIESQRPLVNYA